MQITTRLTLTLATTALLVFGAYGVRLVRAEDARLRADVDHELRLLCRSLQLSIEDALRDRHFSDIRDTLVHLEQLDQTVDILVFDAAGRLEAATDPHGDRPRYDDLARDTLEYRDGGLLTRHVSGPPRALVGAPLASDAGVVVGALVVVRDLGDLEGALAARTRDVVTGVAGFVAATAVLGVVLGGVYIRRPLRRLAAAMRSVRGGDLESEIAVGRQDEMGRVAGEFNAMLVDLREARRRLDEEQEMRRQIVRDLQEVEKLATIGQLAAGLAHEIGSPLQVLQGRAQGLMGAAERPDEVRRIAGILVSQTERITRIIERLLAVARRRPAPVAPLDLARPVGLVVDLLEIEARRRGVSLHLDVAPGLPAVRGDGDALQQVVLNLVRNALQATPSGGQVAVSLERAAARRPGEADESPAVRLRVRDDGAGIDEALQARLFEPFFTTRGDEGGTGLGLSVVRSIVEAHRGAVTVRSEPGAGATFEVVLPADGGPA